MSANTYGTDPEFILTKNDYVISAINVLKYSYFNKYQFDYGSIYYDNVLAEFATIPVSNKIEFIQCIKCNFEALNRIIDSCNISTMICYEFPVDQLNHYDAVVVGCNPDICAYKLKVMRAPAEQIEHGRLRTCGGHIHIGNNLLVDNMSFSLASIYLMDLMLGVPFVIIEANYLHASKRRELYGQAGRFRLASSHDTGELYGVEYRTLSNYWLFHPFFVEMVHDICEKIIHILETEKYRQLFEIDVNYFNKDESDMYDGEYIDDEDDEETMAKLEELVEFKYDYEEVQRVINCCDKSGAIKIMNYISKIMGTTICDKIDKAMRMEVFSIKDAWNIDD